MFNGKQQVKQLFAFSAGSAISNDHAEFKVARVDGDVVIEEWSLIRGWVRDSSPNTIGLAPHARPML